MNVHVDESAELYALGALSEPERKAVEQHILGCTACARRVGEAEETVTGLIAPQPPGPQLDARVAKAFRPRGWFVPAAIAAAFLIGLLPAIFLTRSAHQDEAFRAQEMLADRALVNSHFAHAPFVALTSGAPHGKVLFGRTQPWRYFVVQTNHAYVVASLSHGLLRPIGTLLINGSVGVLFAENAGAHEFELLDGGKAVAAVKLP